MLTYIYLPYAGRGGMQDGGGFLDPDHTYEAGGQGDPGLGASWAGWAPAAAVAAEGSGGLWVTWWPCGLGSCVGLLMAA